MPALPRPHSAAAAALCAALLPLAFTSTAGAVTRTWISGGSGNDANPCSRTAPCLTLAGAISKTDAGGEIDAIDAGGFGAVTITKSITIDFTGTEGSILSSFVNGIVINSATADVVLRNLSINGGPASGDVCTASGLNGILVREANTVRIENVRIGNHKQAAIAITPAASDPKVSIADSQLADNCLNGIKAAPTGGHTVALGVSRTSIFNSGTALSAGAGVSALLSGSTITGNTVGLEHTGTGTIDSYPDNVIAGNETDGAATTQRSIKADPGATGATGATGPAGTPGPTGATGPAAFKLIVAPVTRSLRAKAGAKVKFTYVATAKAKATLTVTKGTKKVATVAGSTVSGTNAITWSAKRAVAGTYKLALRVVGTDGQVASTKATVKLR